MNRVAIYVAFAVLFLGCDRKSASTEQVQKSMDPKEIDPGSLIGKTVGEVRKQLTLKLDDYCVVQEPPGIGRAIQGTNPDGDEIWLYVTREDAVIGGPGSSFDEFKHLKVAGIAIRHQEQWKVFGEVIPYYHWNTK